MKKTIIAIMAGFILTLASTPVTNAQLIASAANFKSKQASFTRIEPAVSIHSKILSREKVPVRALKDFEKKYEVGNETWLKTVDGFVSVFKNDFVITRIYYNEKGFWTFLQKSYYEKDLDKEIRSRVKSQYFDHNILFVHEIIQSDPESEPVYLILIRHEKDGKWIRISSDGMDVYKQINYSGCL